MGQQISILAKLKTFDWRIGFFISFLTFPYLEIYPFSRVNALKLKKLVNPDWPSGLYYKFLTLPYMEMFLISRVMENYPIFHPLNPSIHSQPPSSFSSNLVEPRISVLGLRRKDRGENVVGRAGVGLEIEIATSVIKRDRDSYECYTER